MKKNSPLSLIIDLSRDMMKGYVYDINIFFIKNNNTKSSLFFSF